MAREIIAREDEVARLQAFLAARGSDQPQALILEGEAGIGKSTLWLAAVEAADERGMRVLKSRPSEAEQELPFAGLGDLFEDVLDDVLPALSPPRRRALALALLVEEAKDPLDRRALSVAVRSALELLADAQPLLLAVDDVQWLDGSSADALAFALRRLSLPLHVLLARRHAEGKSQSELELALPAERVARLAVGPLSVGAIQTLLRERLERVFPRPTLLRIHETSGGNPFYALELGRSLPVDVHPTRPFPIPDTLDELVGARLAELPEDTRGALALVAALGSPSDEALRAAGVPWDVLEPALAAHVIEHVGGAIRFEHPLLASILFQGLSAEARRSVHRVLADVPQDALERARHLALASDAPDAAIAQALEDAATRARDRGTVIAAADLAEHALRLTPADAFEDRNRRTIAAGHAHLEAGDARRARALALELAGRQASGRAEALVLLSDIERWSNVGRAIELRREALDAAAQQPALRAEIHAWLGGTLHATEGADRADEHAVTALELADALDDYSLRARALSVLAHVRFRAGSPDGMRLVEQAQRAAADAEPAVRREATMSVVHAVIWSHQLDRARTLLASVDHEWSERDELARWEVLWFLALTELRAGRFALAADHAERAMEIVRQYTADDLEVQSAWLVALIAAHRGELEHARVLAESIEVMANRLPLTRMVAAAVRGVVELASGHPNAAAARFAAADADRRGLGVKEPAMAWWRADQAEALLALGRLDEAAALVDEWEAEAAPLGRDVVLAQVGRCRGLIAAAQVDLEGSVAELERAVAHHEALGDPFGRGRTLLALGIVRRRTRQKRAAREAIADAAALFEECGAEGWAETARAELGKLGGRRREEGLTAAERRVAALVAEGRTNREVAAALFLGERTVETHLTRIYAKLRVRSRTELARVYEPAS
jgi:DNA-binding CsgD family transcriptional regulator